MKISFEKLLLKSNEKKVIHMLSEEQWALFHSKEDL